jgi:hypothetical protein
MPKLEVFGRFYTADVDVAAREREWIEQLKIDILNKTTHTNNILINLTWFNPEEDKLYNLLDNYNPHDTKFWFAASIDGVNWMYNGNFHKQVIDKNFAYCFIGFGPDVWNSWMPKWIHENNKNKNVNLNENFKHYFLSYNRKPKHHRHRLVKTIIENNLLHHGWVTYDKNVFTEIDSYTGHTDNNLMNNDKRFSRPEDMSTLGNLDTWNNCFCVIVTETEYNDPWQISEKTWKPIYGLRPFITVGHNNIQKILKELDFYTTEDLLNYKIDDMTDIINYLKMITSKSKQEVYELYKNILPKLNHNKNKVIELAHKINIL